jgi:hypothetical protein
LIEKQFDVFINIKYNLKIKKYLSIGLMVKEKEIIGIFFTSLYVVFLKGAGERRKIKNKT